MRLNNSSIDIIGFASSLICAIHCAAVPILLSFSSLSSLHFLGNPFVEWSFIILGIVFAFLSLWPSYKKTHHQIKPISFAVVGFLCIGLGRLELSEFWETSFTVIGATWVASSHYINWKLLKNSNPHHKH